ncbi:MAG: transposase [Phycisphaerae bacterium]|nr:transposase [Phycisphaerae bacterium]
MPQYRRLDCPGATVFFTVVTAQRRPILTGPAIDLLRDAVRAVQHAHPFEINAAVILPDHLHMLWTLPPNDDDYSNRWFQIKSRFTREYLKNGGAESTRSASRERRSERGVWQRRFWEHVVRNDDEFGAFCDYIHLNPLKHGLAACPHFWPHSSFHTLVRKGIYAADWLCGCRGERPPLPHHPAIESLIGE